MISFKQQSQALLNETNLPLDCFNEMDSPEPVYRGDYHAAETTQLFQPELGGHPHTEASTGQTGWLGITSQFLTNNLGPESLQEYQTHFLVACYRVDKATRDALNEVLHLTFPGVDSISLSNHITGPNPQDLNVQNRHQGPIDH